MEQAPLDILVIEDDVDTCENLRDILELDGHRVRISHSATAATAGDDATWASVVLLDWKLPDATAPDVLSRLKKAGSEAEVIIITGHGDFDRAVSALRRGVTDYLLKPINPEAMRSCLQRLAHRRWVALEKQRATEQRVQSERLAAIGEAMTALAHESRKALQRSQAYLELLADVVSDQPQALQLVGRVQEAQGQLHQLYEEVRQYAAPIRLEPHPYPIPELVLETWSQLHLQHQGRDAQLSFERSCESPVCRADRFMLQQVFRNIMENSLAACDDPVRIVYSCRTLQDGSGDWFELTLRDNGPGLDAEQRQRIFDPFYTTKTCGTGLGMTLCRRVVEAHGGRIEVGSGPGTAIVITLPLAS